MIAIPRATLLLSFIGLAPFLLGALFHLLGLFGNLPAIALAVYGSVVLASLGGALLGFTLAGREGDSPMLVGLSFLPVLVGFLTLLIGVSDWDAPLSLLEILALSYLLGLLLENVFAMNDLTPLWWFSLRVPTVTIAIICMLVGTYL